MTFLIYLIAAFAQVAFAQRYLLDINWHFELNTVAPQCTDPNSTFPMDLDNKVCSGLHANPNVASLESCIDTACADDTSNVYQWCPIGATNCNDPGGCWTGPVDVASCSPSQGWVSRGRSTLPPPPPDANSTCVVSWCKPATDDSSWRSLNLPHDFVVEGNFSKSASMSQGYLPFGVGYYRKHMILPASLSTSSVFFIDLEGAQGISTVYLNGFLIGTHNFGYTSARFFIDSSQLNFGASNLIAISVDATKPDSWWYDGGGINRHVFFTAINTPGPYLGPFGIYAPSSVDGPITWAASGQPTGDSSLSPTIEIWNNASQSSAFSLSLSVYSPTGLLVASTSGSGTAQGNGAITLWEAQSMAIPAASLWHLVSLPLVPSLYTLVTSLTVGGNVIETKNVTFGIRTTRFDAATGFYLNGIATKILGTANHQDYPAVGVAVPDHIQWHRVSKLKEMGVNGWRTAHNPPNPALLDAMDELGMVCWDENHRNGQPDQVPLLVRRDRNHPSVVIWSICNEVLCNVPAPADWVQEALIMKAAFQTHDPKGNRPVSANQNGWVGPKTPLDLQGFDYSTGNYDTWHANAPNIPSISSETSSAVSDRSEYTSNALNHWKGVNCMKVLY